MNQFADFSSSARHAAGDHPATILVVDDEPVIRHLLDCVLSREGYRVLLAEDSIDALEMASAPSSESFSFLITDLCLPRITGIELAAELRATRPELMTLFISGISPVQFSALGADMAQSAFVPKPFRMTHILEALSALAGRRPLSSSASLQASCSGMAPCGRDRFEELALPMNA